MYILPQERPQGVNYQEECAMIPYEGRLLPFEIADTCKFCIKCKHSKPNISYPKDEFDCEKTKGICNALCTCDQFEEDA